MTHMMHSGNTHFSQKHHADLLHGDIQLVADAIIVVERSTDTRSNARRPIRRAALQRFMIYTR